MPTLYMLVGVPGSGKSTWLVSQNFDMSNTTILSTDNFLEAVAAERGLTYSDVYRDEMKNAEKFLKQSLTGAITNGYNIIWDQTNVSAKARRKKLNKIPKDYKKVGIYFVAPAMDELIRRLANRPGKHISERSMRIMFESLSEPSLDEGFDDIIIVK